LTDFVQHGKLAKFENDRSAMSMADDIYIHNEQFTANGGGVAFSAMERAC
jgi:hypothetical protein